MGVKDNYFTNEICKSSNIMRLSSSARKSTEKAKKARKLHRAKKKGFLERLEENKGVIYKKGGF